MKRRIPQEADRCVLELCGTNSKKPGAISGTGLIEQIKMVAGARFELTTFRL